MNYRTVLSSEAAKTILRVDNNLRARLQKRIHELAEDPSDPRLSSPLSGRPGVRKSRVGGWRILFTVDREKQLVQVVAVDTRGQVSTLTISVGLQGKREAPPTIELSAAV